MKLNFWRNLWLSLPKLLGKVDGNSVSWGNKRKLKGNEHKSSKYCSKCVYPHLFVSIKSESHLRLNDCRTTFSIDKTEFWKPRLHNHVWRPLTQNMINFTFIAPTKDLWKVFASRPPIPHRPSRLSETSNRVRIKLSMLF